MFVHLISATGRPFPERAVSLPIAQVACGADRGTGEKFVAFMNEDKPDEPLIALTMPLEVFLPLVRDMIRKLDTRN